MRFYIIQTNEGETIGCELTRKAAQQAAEGKGYRRDEIEVTPVDVAVTADNIRRLLGNLGGFSGI